jgi:hypothetical protein
VSRSRSPALAPHAAHSRLAILRTRPSRWWTNTWLGGFALAIPMVCSIASSSARGRRTPLDRDCTTRSRLLVRQPERSTCSRDQLATPPAEQLRARGPEFGAVLQIERRETDSRTGVSRLPRGAVRLTALGQAADYARATSSNSSAACRPFSAAAACAPRVSRSTSARARVNSSVSPSHHSACEAIASGARSGCSWTSSADRKRRRARRELCDRRNRRSQNASGTSAPRVGDGASTTCAELEPTA